MVTKKDLLKYKTLMIKSNYIIEASYKLSLSEQRLIYMLISRINKSDIEFKSYKFTQTEINNVLSKHKITYNELSQHIDSLRNKELVIIKEKSILKTKWLSSAEYFEDGSIELCFDDKLKPYLLQLKARFTKLSMNMAITFNSNYSCRIYELLKQYENIGKRIISIEALRTIFCIEPQEYSRYNDFKRKVLLQAQKEINSNTDIFFEFEEIKTGRKITSIKFIINSTAKAKHEIVSSKENKEKPSNDLIKQVQLTFHKHNITEHEASCILIDANNNLILIKQCYEYLLTKDYVKNIVGYMRKLVKGFDKPQINIKIDSFNNYEQRTYDFEKLEENLLGWKK